MLDEGIYTFFFNGDWELLVDDSGAFLQRQVQGDFNVSSVETYHVRTIREIKEITRGQLTAYWCLHEQPLNSLQRDF